MRYQGSKSRLAKDIIPIITKNLYGTDRVFIDLFAGGMNLVDKVNHPNKIAVDVNSYIIQLWNDIKSKGVEGTLPPYVTKEDYDRAHKQYVNGNIFNGEFTMGQIGFIATACSYGAGWFKGYAHYNPKKNEDHIKEAYNGLKKQVDRFYNLEKTYFWEMDYRQIIIKLSQYNWFKGKDNQIDIKKLVVYCDPPYAETLKYPTDFDTVSFWNWVRAMAQQGLEIYVSEYNAPDDFKCIWQKDVPDGMGITIEGRKQNRKIEKLFVYNG